MASGQSSEQRQQELDLIDRQFCLWGCDQTGDRIEQLDRLEWLRKRCCSSKKFGHGKIALAADEAAAGDGNDFDVRIEATNFQDRLDTVFPGHDDVGDNDLWAEHLKMCNAIDAVVGDFKCGAEAKELRPFPYAAILIYCSVIALRRRVMSRGFTVNLVLTSSSQILDKSELFLG